MIRLVTDIETDGLLPDLTRLWVATTHDLDTGEARTYTAGSWDNYLRYLAAADEVWGHNVADFDLRALKKLFPRWEGVPWQRVYDTLTGSKLAVPEIEVWDYAEFVPAGLMTKKMAGAYSLESWGIRFGRPKVGLDVDFSHFNEPMVQRNKQDVVINVMLVEFIQDKLPPQAWGVERKLQPYLLQQEENGFPFNVSGAAALASRLRGLQSDTRDELISWGGTWVKPGAVWTPKRNDRRHGYYAGAPASRMEIVTFNPGSRDHIAKRLADLYGWVPETFTDSGAPQVDEKVLAPLAAAVDETGAPRYPLVTKLTEYLDLGKKLGYVMDGDNAWLKLYSNDGPGGIALMHGSVDQLGAATGRASHRHPNLGQVPHEKEYRDLFYAPDGWVLVGTDMSGIELRMLAHFMAYFDGGEYAKIVLEGDVHSENAKAWGVARPVAKTGVYALIYGAGDPKLGRTLHPNILGEEAQRVAGRKARRALMGRFPALELLTEDVKEKGRNKGFLLGLDKRRLPMRSEHSALNTVLQSGGAISSKFWINNVNDRLTADLGPQGWGGKWAAMVWVHDELQILTRPQYADQVAQAMVWGIEEAGRQLNLNLPITGKSTIGKTWGDTH